MIAEEVRMRLRELVEADDEADSKKKPSKPGTEDASDSPSPKSKEKTATNTGTVSTPDLDQEEDPDGPAVDGGQPDPDAAQDDEEEEADAIDPEGDGGDEPSGVVNDELSGKTVQSVTIEPKSKVLPGAKEVVLSFNESTDTLRILITATGNVKFFWRGQLHDIP